MKHLAFVIGTLVAALALAGSALANARTVSDPRNDFKGSHWQGAGFVWSASEGCWADTSSGECDPDSVYFENLGGYLDITSARHGHTRAGLVTQRLTVSRRWQPSLLGPELGGQISFFISTDRDAAWERRLDVVLVRGNLRAVMRNEAGRSVGSGSTSRPDGRSVQVAFGRRLLGQGVRSYRWLAFAGVACRRQYDACGDRTPGDALVGHGLG